MSQIRWDALTPAMLKRALIISTTSELSIEPPPSLKVGVRPIWMSQKMFETYQRHWKSILFYPRQFVGWNWQFCEVTKQDKEIFLLWACESHHILLKIHCSTAIIVKYTENCLCQLFSLLSKCRLCIQRNQQLWMKIKQYKPCSAWQTAPWSSLRLGTLH